MDFVGFLSEVIMFFVRLGFFIKGDGDDDTAQGILDTIQKTLREIFK